MNQKTKKLLILNIPYMIIGLICTNVGEAWRASPHLIWRSIS